MALALLGTMAQMDLSGMASAKPPVGASEALRPTVYKQIFLSIINRLLLYTLRFTILAILLFIRIVVTPILLNQLLYQDTPLLGLRPLKSPIASLLPLLLLYYYYTLQQPSIDLQRLIPLLRDLLQGSLLLSYLFRTSELLTLIVFCYTLYSPSLVGIIVRSLLSTYLRKPLGSTTTQVGAY